MLRRAIPAPLTEAMLATELNPDSAQLKRNLKVIKERAQTFGVPIPGDTQQFRMELGLVTEDELYPASLSWFSSRRMSARHALAAHYPEKYQVFLSVHRRRLFRFWSIVVLAIFVTFAWLVLASGRLTAEKI